MLNAVGSFLKWVKPFGMVEFCTLWGGKGGGGAPAPDPNIGRAAMMSARQGQEFLDFMKQQYADGKPRQEVMDALSQRASEQQMRIADSAESRAQQGFNRYQTQFVPLEDRLIAEANHAGSAADQAAAAGRFSSDIEAQSAMQRDATDRNMMSMGVNPNSGRFAGTARANELRAMAMRAGGMTQARDAAKAQGIALRSSVANLGRGMSADTNAAGALALQGGSGALNAGMAGNNYQMQRANQLGQGYGMAQQGYGQQANILGQQFAAESGAWAGQQQAQAAGTSAAISGIATVGAAAFI